LHTAAVTDDLQPCEKLLLAMCACRPVKLLRLVTAVVFKVFYITVLNYLLGPLNCSWLAVAKVRYNVDFPDQSEHCWARQRLIATSAVVSAMHTCGSIWFVHITIDSSHWLAVGWLE
jgi:hypothetical protein